MIKAKCDCCWNDLSICSCSNEEIELHDQQRLKERKELDEWNARDRHYNTKNHVGWRETRYCDYCNRFIIPIDGYYHCSCKSAIEEWKAEVSV